MPTLSPRTWRLLGLGAAVLIAGALVAPVVLTNGSGGRAAACNPRLRYAGELYGRRPVGGVAPAQGAAVGVGLLAGCGPVQNVNVRSLLRIRAARAVAIDGDTDLYVRAGVCPHAPPAGLVACLRAG